MIRVHAAPLHFPEHPIIISPCDGYGFYAIRMGPLPDCLGPELTIHISREQLEDMRDQLNTMFPTPKFEAARVKDLEALYPDPRDYPGSIFPPLMAGEVSE